MGPERRQVTPRSGGASVGVTSLKERALAPQQKVIKLSEEVVLGEGHPME